MIRFNYDALGIAASLICAIHCAVLPLLLTSLPVFGTNIIDNAAFEYLMILLALVVGYRSLRHGYRKHHHNLMPLVVFSIGAVLLMLKQLFHDQQLWFLVPAVLAIVIAHAHNYRMCRKAGCSH